MLQGELRIYRPNGELKEVRPVGSYILTPAGGEPHTEGGGDQDVIALFSNRNVDKLIYEILDEDMKPIATFAIPEFKALLDGPADLILRRPSFYRLSLLGVAALARQQEMPHGRHTGNQ